MVEEQGDLQDGGELLQRVPDGWSEFRLLLRILDGRGLRVADIHIPVPIVTNANLHIYATPGKPLSWPGEPRGPIDGWASNKTLDGYFHKPGNPGGL